MDSRVRLQAYSKLYVFYLLLFMCGLFLGIYYCFDDSLTSFHIHEAVNPHRNILHNQSMSRTFQRQERKRKLSLESPYSGTQRLDHFNKSNKMSEKIPRDFHFPETLRTTPVFVSCPQLLSGNAKMGRKQMTMELNPKLSYRFYEKVTKDCRKFKHKRNYISSYLTQEEKDFPIAYGMVVYKDIEQVERLLRAIYRPQNYYCIHVDLKAKTDFRKTLARIVDCFDNVFITKKSVDVRWGEFSVLKSQLICMSELWKYKNWKYFINLSGQEFPLKTNAEIVKILKSYNGSNDVRISDERVNNPRWSKAGRAPAGIRPVKGSLFVAVNRHFVDYVLHNDTAKKLLDWCKKTTIPDETFFPSLHFNKRLGIQGSAKGEQKTALTKFINWASSDFPCKGKYVRYVCIFGVDDLPLLKKRPESFANKFHLDFQPLALDCMEELIYNRTRDEYRKTVHLKYDHSKC